MNDVLRSEFRKLRTTRTAFGLLAGAVVLHGPRAVGFAERRDAGRTGGGPHVAVRLRRGGRHHRVVFVMVLGIRSFTDEVRHGSIVPTFLATPKRLRVLAAKTAVSAAAAVVFAIAALGVGTGVIAVYLVAHGYAVPVAAWSLAWLFAQGDRDRRAVVDHRRVGRRRGAAPGRRDRRRARVAVRGREHPGLDRAADRCLAAGVGRRRGGGHGQREPADHAGRRHARARGMDRRCGRVGRRGRSGAATSSDRSASSRRNRPREPTPRGRFMHEEDLDRGSHLTAGPRSTIGRWRSRNGGPTGRCAGARHGEGSHRARRDLGRERRHRRCDRRIGPRHRRDRGRPRRSLPPFDPFRGVAGRALRPHRGDDPRFLGAEGRAVPAGARPDVRSRR